MKDPGVVSYVKPDRIAIGVNLLKNSNIVLRREFSLERG